MKPFIEDCRQQQGKGVVKLVPHPGFECNQSRRGNDGLQAMGPESAKQNRDGTGY